MKIKTMLLSCLDGRRSGTAYISRLINIFIFMKRTFSAVLPIPERYNELISLEMDAARLCKLNF